MTRESVFRCSFTSARARRVAHVRAWNEREAAQLFQEELAEDELREPGRIEVVGVRGGRMEAPFEPPAQTH
jgi:hypothetical protein